MKAKIKNKKGFTLFEILLSLAVFSIFASVIPDMLSFYEKQIVKETNKSEREISSIMISIERAYQKKVSDTISENVLVIATNDSCQESYFYNDGARKTRTCSEPESENFYSWINLDGLSFEIEDTLLKITFLTSKGAEKVHYIKR